jgi:hypothetical protein
MPGQEFANAITSLLFGDENPSGKLPLTFPNVENEMQLSTAQWPGTTIPPPQGFCENDTFVAEDLGCYNTSNAQWASLSDNLRPNPRAVNCSHFLSCLFCPLLSSTLCICNQANMTWGYVAQRCNAAGYPYAAVDGGDGAGIHCASELPPAQFRLPEGGPTYNVPSGNNLCNKTQCRSGHYTLACLVHASFCCLSDTPHFVTLLQRKP